MEEALHPRRERILRYLARRAGSGEPPPSVREVGVEVGLRSSQTVHHHLRKLEEEGYVARESGARMVRLTEKGWGLPDRLGNLGGVQPEGSRVQLVATPARQR